MSPSSSPLNIAITGAAGQIGYALLFRLLAGYPFGANTPLNVKLIELPQALPSLTGLKMEIEDCAFPLLNRLECTSSFEEGFKDANWIILIGSVPRKPGMERSDLLKINANIFKEQGQAIDKVAADNARIFVVGNPCNTNALVAAHQAKRLPKENYFAMTKLDELRARAQLANKAQVTIDQVSCVPIWGNHSATQFPDFYQAKIQGKPSQIIINDESWLQTEFIKTIQQRGAAVLNARNASSAASAANAVLASLYDLNQPNTQGDFFSVASYSTGAHYHIEPDIMFSFPSKMVNNKLQVVSGLELNRFSQEKIQATMNELKSERDAVKALGLI